MRPPRVAVVGGGVSGTMCAMMLRCAGVHVTVFDKGQKRLGGRASNLIIEDSSRSDAPSLCFDSGAQFIAVTDPRFEGLLHSPVMKGLLPQWKGRFGILGRSGQVLPRETVMTSRVMRKPRPTEGQQIPPTPDDDDDDDNFFRMLEGEETVLRTGANGVGGLCEAICARTSVECIYGANVTSIHLEEGRMGFLGKWHVNAVPITSTTSDPRTISPTPTIPTEPFDAIVLSNHDPSLAADVIDGLLKTSRVATLGGGGVGHQPTREVVAQFVEQLRTAAASRRSLFSLMIAYDRPLHEVAFDGVSLHGSDIIHFLARDSSKPGLGRSDGRECWTAVSSQPFADWMDEEWRIAVAGGRGDVARNRPSLNKEETAMAAAVHEERAREIMMGEFESRLGTFFPHRNMPSPVFSKAQRWDAASFNPIGLDEDNEAVTFHPWGLAVCGDYLGTRQGGLQEAALSGLRAASNVSSWLVQP